MPHHRKKEVSSHDPTSLAGLLPAGIQSGDFPLIPPICLSEPVNEFMLFQHSDEVQQGKRRNEQDVHPEVVDHDGVSEPPESSEGSRPGRATESFCRPSFQFCGLFFPIPG